MPYRAWKFVRRYKALVAAMLILAVGVVVSSWQAVRATRAEQEQNRLRTVAQKEGLTALRQAYIRR